MLVAKNENSRDEVKKQLERQKTLHKLKSLEYSIKELKEQKRKIEALLYMAESEQEVLKKELKGE